MQSVSDSLAENLSAFESELCAPRNEDVITHRFACLGAEAALIFIDGMTDREMTNISVLKPCLSANADSVEPCMRAEYLISHVLNACGAKLAESPDEALSLMLSGRALLLIDGCAQVIVCDVPGFNTRAVSQPVTESVIVGPHEGFNENLRTNITLIRRIIRAPQLITEMLEIGTEVKKRVALMYMNGIARADIVDTMRRRVQSLNIATITEIGQIEQLIEDSPSALIPQMLMTERPDRAASCLMDGQVVLLCDGSPTAMAAPATLFHMIHASDDTNMRWEYGTFIRIVRVIGMLLSMLLPGLYLALVLFQPEVIPLGLLTSIMETHAKVPFPTVVEVLILVLSFDLIQESATRVPGMLGSTLGIVGALILGEAAVSADIISPILVIVIALTGLGNYAVPDYQFSIALRILRLLFIFAGASAGLFGLSLAAFFCTTYMCGMKSLGQPFLAPMAPYRPHNPDILLRLPLYCQRYRLFTATPAARRAAGKRVRGWKRNDNRGGGK